MAGTSRGEDWDQPKRLLHVGGSLGFHAPYLSLKDTEGYSSKDVKTFFDLANRMWVRQDLCPPIPFSTGVLDMREPHFRDLFKGSR